MVYLVGVAAALALGVGYVLQQRVAATMPLSDVLRLRLLVDLMRQRLWWVGLGCMVAGQLLAGLALNLAAVAVVEPLLSTSLLFALALSASLARQRIRWQEACGAVLVSAALGVFIAVGNPRSSASAGTTGLKIGIAVAAVVTAVALLVSVGKRRGLVGESVLLATGAGLTYGLQDVATRGALVVADHHGITSMFFNPWMYVVIGAALVGILLSQSAFKAARLDYSLPPIAAAEPIAGIFLGVILLGDVVSVTVAGLAVESVCLVAGVAGVVLIGRSANLAASCGAVGTIPEVPASSR
jgi:drug/metabolite transporter (DMT)-like permease